MKARVLTFSAASFLFAAALFARSAADIRLVLAFIALSFLPYSFLFSLSDNHWATLCRHELWLALAFAALGFVGLTPALSTDVFRYLWDGQAILQGFNPACVTPTQTALPLKISFELSQLNHATLSSPYPIGSQLIFALAAGLGGSFVLFQVLALAVHGCTAYVLLRAAPVNQMRATYLYALNPLLIVESAWSAHCDFFMGFFLLLGALAYERPTTHGKLRALFAWSLAAALKLTGLLPLFWAACQRRKRSYFFWLGALALAIASPQFLCHDASHAHHGLTQYATRWSGHTLFFMLFQNDVADFLKLFKLNAALAPLATRTLIGTGLILFVFYLSRAVSNALLATRAAVLALLLFSPQFHPWYIAWLLPLEAAIGRRAGFFLSAAMLGMYIPLADWESARIWHDSALFLWFITIIVVITLLLETKAELRQNWDASLKNKS